MTQKRLTSEEHTSEELTPQEYLEEIEEVPVRIYTLECVVIDKHVFYIRPH